MSTLGRLNPVKERLMALIAASDGSLDPKATHVRGDWSYMARLVGSTGALRNMPIVTVRLATSLYDNVYGRDLEGGASPKQGNMVEIPWTAHVHALATKVSGQDRHKGVQELADKIVDYLLKEADNQGAFGIEDIYEVTARESDVANAPRNLCRIIIEGRMLCRRPD